MVITYNFMIHLLCSILKHFFIGMVIACIVVLQVTNNFLL